MAQAVPPRAGIGGWIIGHRYTLALAAIVAASLAFRLHVSHECSLWLDEGNTAQDIARPWPELLRGPKREHPPLMYWLVRLATDVLGRGDTGIRSVSLGFGCVLLVAVYLLCLELELSKLQGLAAAASLSLTPFFMRHAIEARHYAVAGAFVTLATVFALRLWRGPFRLRTLAGLAVCSVAASAVQYFAFAYVLSLWGALIVGTVRRWQPRALPARQRVALASVLGLTFVAFGAISMLVVSLAHWYRVHSSGSQVHHHFSIPAIWHDFSFLARPPWPELEPFVAAFGLLFLALRRRSLAGLIPAGLAFGPIAVASLLSSGHALTPRYLFPSFIFYHLGEVAAVFGVFELLAARAGAFARPLSALGVLVLAVPLGVRLHEYPAGFGAGQVNYRGLQAYFDGHRGRDTALVVFVGYAGMTVMRQYPVPHLMSLESFEPIVGIDRYLIAEFHSTDREVTARFAVLLKRHFGLSLKQWRSLRLVRLAATPFQGPVRARLVTLDADSPLRRVREDTSQAPPTGAANGAGDDGAAPSSDGATEDGDAD